MNAPTTPLDHALALAEAGFHVFPLLPWPEGDNPGKTPAVKYKEWATRDAAKISDWWGRRPNCGVAIYTGRYGDNEALIAVDIDVKDGKKGGETAARLDEEFGFPDTREHETPTGGSHLLYRHSVPVKQGVDVLGPGIDIRSGGGFIVAPGSAIDGKPYTVLSPDLPAPAPQWIVERCGQQREKPEPKQAAIEVDTTHAAKRAAEYLATAPLAIEGQGGDETTFKVAARVKDFGVSEPDCLALMLDHYNPRCQPPWTADELAAKVRNAYAYGQEPQGIAAPEADFKPVQVDPFDIGAPAAAPVVKAEAPKHRFKIRFAGEIEPRLDKLWVVDGVIPAGGLAMLCAKPNEAKTFNAIAIGMAAARGVPWHGCETLRGSVLYIDADGNIDNRVTAYVKHNGLEGMDIPFAIITDVVNLHNAKGDVAPLIQAAQDVADRSKQPLALIVVDTLARVLAGGDENSGQDMGAVLAHVARIQRETGAAVLLIHHEGKDASRGARGHSSLLAAVDAALEIKDGIIRVEKQRDGETGARFGFRLVQVPVGMGRRGRQVTSCVTVPIDAGAADDFARQHIKPGSVAARALTTLENLTLGGGKVLSIAWRDEFVQQHYPSRKKAGWTAFDRAVSALDEANRVRREGGYAAPVV